jgi:DNA-binding PadR family transcriptional regulator
MNDLILLAILLEGPQHGYALKKKAGLITGHGEMHNNLVYPLLKRFVSKAWVSRRSAGGQRGQTRELYSLTAKGRRELIRALSEFDEKTARSPGAFWLRVSLFALLDQATRTNILDQRAEWLVRREAALQRIAEQTGVRGWGGAVMDFLHSEVQAERKWIGRLRKKAAEPGNGGLA